MGDFQPDRIGRYIRHTLDAAQDCVPEIILKDTRTCRHHPERFDQRTRIAPERIDRKYGN